MPVVTIYAFGWLPQPAYYCSGPVSLSTALRSTYSLQLFVYSTSVAQLYSSNLPAFFDAISDAISNGIQINYTNRLKTSDLPQSGTKVNVKP